MTRYSEEEGAKVGYNTNKRGRASPHPLMVFIADARMIAHCWLRPGDAHTVNNCAAFLHATLDNLGDKRVALLRADSGFCANGFLEVLENKQLHYIIALRLNQPLQRALVNQDGIMASAQTTAANTLAELLQALNCCWHAKIPRIHTLGV